MRINSIIALVLFSLCSSAQSPYSLQKKKDAIIIGSGLLAGGASFLLNSSQSGLSSLELSQLSKESINKLDQGTINNYSEQASITSDYGVYVPFALSGIMVSSLTLKKKKEKPFSDFLTLGTIWFESNLVCLSINQLTKNSVKRVRPYAYSNISFTDEYPNDADIRKSFFSGHTSLSAANSFFIAKVLHDYYPEKEWTKIVWAGAAIVPAWTGYQRYKAGKHFPTDILAGYLVGSACGILIPQMHKSTENKKALRVSPAGNRVFLVYQF